jgi:hypothetical protein
VGAKRQPSKLFVLTVVVVHLTAMAVTWWDLRDRPAAQVRGSTTVWRVASAVNTLGSAAYWLLGRRGHAPRRVVRRLLSVGR